MSSNSPSGTERAVATAPGSDGVLIWSGAERVELSERFYRGVFVGCLVFVALAAAAALALLPLRDPVGIGAAPTIALAAALVLLAPLGVWRSRELYLLFRREPKWELPVVAVAAALVAYPLRSELWWPSCALLMLIGTLAPLRRTAAYCLAVLLINLVAHVIAGDLDDIPAVTIIGLWVGFGFWSAAFALSTDRLASHILRMRQAPADEPRDPPLRVDATVVPTPTSEVDARVTTPPYVAPSRLEALTFRQLQVVALLADGLRYAEVAASLGISTRQVQRHVTDSIARLGVLSANELVAVAKAEGIADPASTFEQ
ncbi:MAG: LuxR C-terminal-related transcriptional regulator [Solirubrobacteraceae bacterium MAG38_C4-C5]|nr:LuxR C-terminal-related transcriptional regulator [Candidatus Siliceabacter maunaloa]